MNKITKENIQDYALKLMFKMKDNEYDTFEKEFETIIKHMDLIGKIDGIENVEPLVYPFINEDVNLREDKVGIELTEEEVISNAKDVVYGEIKVPKVVGGEE